MNPLVIEARYIPLVAAYNVYNLFEAMPLYIWMNSQPKHSIGRWMAVKVNYLNAIGLKSADIKPLNRIDVLRVMKECFKHWHSVTHKGLTSKHPLIHNGDTNSWYRFVGHEKQINVLNAIHHR